MTGLSKLHLSAPVDEDEARMRRALDMNRGDSPRTRQDQSHGPRPSRQFAQDGDVPVVRLTGRKDQPNPAIAKLEEALAAERSAREHAETALRQANATIQMLQTKLAHAEMAHSEALAAQLQAQAQMQVDAQARSDAQAAEQQTARANAAATEPKRPARSAGPAEEEEPVQWWVPGWREGLGRGR